jgi:hypothetical protein
MILTDLVTQWEYRHETPIFKLLVLRGGEPYL